MVRPLQPIDAASRRDVLQLPTAMTLGLQGIYSAEDPALALCRRWQANDQQSRRLITSWQRLETWLFRNRDWPKLTPEQQAIVPEAAPLAQIDAQLDLLEEERVHLLPKIRTTPALSREGLLQKLEVATQLFAVDEQPEARGLLRSVRDDLLRLWT